MSAKFDFKTLHTGFEADWPVEVRVPIDGGAFETQTFMARFKSLTKEEQAELDAIEDRVGKAERLLELGWLGLAASEDHELTSADRAEMLNAPNVVTAIYTAFTAFRTGIVRGN